MFIKRKPLINIEIEIDEVQKERISIFTSNEVKRKIGQFLTTYNINDPKVKKRIMDRILMFFKQIEEKKLFRSPIQESKNKTYKPNYKTLNKLNYISKKKQLLQNRIKGYRNTSPLVKGIK